MNAAAAEQLVLSFEQGRLSRRQLVAQLVALGAATTGLSAVARGSAEPATGPTFTATSIDHLALSVTDVKRSAEFYRRHLGLTSREERANGMTFLSCAQRDFLALFPAREAGMHHFSFSVPDYDAADAAKRLEAAGLKPERHGNRVYFPDPDGLRVQVHA